MTFFWSSLHFGLKIGHLGSDDLFFVIALHCSGQKFGQPRGGVKFGKSSPPNLEKWQKMINFAESFPPPNGQYRFAPLLPDQDFKTKYTGK